MQRWYIYCITARLIKAVMRLDDCILLNDNYINFLLICQKVRCKTQLKSNKYYDERPMPTCRIKFFYVMKANLLIGEWMNWEWMNVKCPKHGVNEIYYNLLLG